MKNLIDKFQHELTHLQNSLQKESKVILSKLKKLDLKENLDTKRKELEKIIERKYKTFLPTANRFANELRTIGKKVGIDVEKWEKNVMQTTGAVKKKLAKKLAMKKPAKTKTLKKVDKKKTAKKKAAAKQPTA
jgi:hypothetical protein